KGDHRLDVMVGGVAEQVADAHLLLRDEQVLALHPHAVEVLEDELARVQACRAVVGPRLARGERRQRTDEERPTNLSAHAVSLPRSPSEAVLRYGDAELLPHLSSVRGSATRRGGPRGAAAPRPSAGSSDDSRREAVPRCPAVRRWHPRLRRAPECRCARCYR